MGCASDDILELFKSERVLNWVIIPMVTSVMLALILLDAESGLLNYCDCIGARFKGRLENDSAGCKLNTCNANTTAVLCRQTR